MRAFFGALIALVLAVAAGEFLLPSRETAPSAVLDLTAAKTVYASNPVSASALPPEPLPVESDAAPAAPVSETKAVAEPVAEPVPAPAVVTQIVKLGAKECAALMGKKMFESTAYVPEISTTGQSVAPADLPDENVSALADMTFPVIVKLKRTQGADDRTMRAEPVLTVRLKDGKVYLNDAPADDGDTETLRAACGSAAH